MSETTQRDRVRQLHSLMSVPVGWMTDEVADRAAQLITDIVMNQPTTLATIDMDLSGTIDMSSIFDHYKGVEITVTNPALEQT